MSNSFINVLLYLKNTCGLISVPRALLIASYNHFLSLQLSFAVENLNSKSMENKEA